MANEEHLAILRQGAEGWNQWRRENQEVKPDVSGADLSSVGARAAVRVPLHVKKASWLNIAELERSALSRICVARRIHALETRDREMQAVVAERKAGAIKVA